MKYVADSNVIISDAVLKYDEGQSLKLDKIFDQAFNPSVTGKMRVSGYYGYEKGNG